METKRMNSETLSLYGAVRREEEWWTEMADEGFYGVNSSDTEDIDGVCRGLHTDSSILHGMSTKKGAIMAERGAPGEKGQMTGNSERTWRT